MLFSSGTARYIDAWVKQGQEHTVESGCISIYSWGVPDLMSNRVGSLELSSYNLPTSKMFSLFLSCATVDISVNCEAMPSVELQRRN